MIKIIWIIAVLLGAYANYDFLFSGSYLIRPHTSLLPYDFSTTKTTPAILNAPHRALAEGDFP